MNLSVKTDNVILLFRYKGTVYSEKHIIPVIFQHLHALFTNRGLQYCRLSVEPFAIHRGLEQRHRLVAAELMHEHQVRLYVYGKNTSRVF